jgi:hypothetical protein
MANSRAIARLISEFGRERFAFWRLRPEADRRAALTKLAFAEIRVMFCTMSRSNRWIREKAAASNNPAPVETVLIHLEEHWPETAQSLAEAIEQFPLGEAALLHLLAVSSICAARLTHDPDSLLWLCQPQICSAPRGYAEMLGYLQRSAGNSIADQGFSALRFW